MKGMKIMKEKTGGGFWIVFPGSLIDGFASLMS